MNGPKPGDAPVPGIFATPTLALGTISVALLILVFLRCFSIYEINYNEGWNAWWQSVALRGGSLYPNSGALIFDNYPPLSFLMVSNLARVSGLDVVVAGRILSLVALIFVIIFSGGVAFQLAGRSTPTSIYCMILTSIVFCSAFTIYAGMNDPQLLSQAFMMAALFVYVRYGAFDVALTGVVALLIVGGLVKHSGISIPLAIALDCMLTSRRRGLIFVGASVAGLLAAGAWLHYVSDGHIWSALSSPRQYSFAASLSLLWDTVRPMRSFAMVAALGFLILLPKMKYRLLVIYGIVGLCFALVLGGGSGTYVNMYFDAAIAGCIAIPLALVEADAAGWLTRIPSARMAYVAVVAFAAFGSLPWSWAQIRQLRPDTIAVRDTVEDIAWLRARPGKALCDSMLLCFWAGKEILLDPFNTGQAIATGAIPASRLQQLTEDKDLHTIEKNIVPPSSRASGSNSGVVGTRPAADPRFQRDRESSLHVFWSTKTD